MSAHKKLVDQLVRVYPRFIPLVLPTGKDMAKVVLDGKGEPVEPVQPDNFGLTDCQRPLRAETMQGPRTALANSEAAPAGTTMEFEVEVMAVKKSITSMAVLQAFPFGEKVGLGQWRNAGKGRFSVVDAEILEDGVDSILKGLNSLKDKFGLSSSAEDTIRRAKKTVKPKKTKEPKESKESDEEAGEVIVHPPVASGHGARVLAEAENDD